MRLVLALALFGAGEAFMPAGRPATGWLTQTRVTRLSEIEEEAEGNQKQYIKYKEENDGIREVADQNQGPTSYDNFIDSEGFDGGDGQVGCVGSDEMEGEKSNSGIVGFDDSSTRAGMQSRSKVNLASDVRSESKKTQRNAFGTFTGYADELKEKGMVDIHSETGEDMLLARRQQLENWRNQRELRSQQEDTLGELAGFTGTAYDGGRTGSTTYMNRLNAGVQEDESKWNVYKGEELATEADIPAEGLQKGDITEVIEMSSSFPKPSFAEIKVENDVISFEHFVVGFTNDSDAGDFQVSPLSGELARRGGDPQILSLVFKPNAPGGTRDAWIVVQTEESKWTYHVKGTVM